MLFAAHDEVSIYAIGPTAEAAIQNARDDAGDPDARFETTPIGEDLAAQIERDGWNPHTQTFDVRGGRIVETTGD